MEFEGNLSGAIEAMLFIHGEPMEIKKITKLLNCSEEEVRISLNGLAEDLKNSSRGLFLIFKEDRVQLATKPELAPLVESFVKSEFEESLTPAALETLSLIAYLGPISRAKIDYLRGVNSSYSVRNLLLRGLVERSSDPQRGNVYLYQLSFDLLKHLGISSIKDLPEYQKFKDLAAAS